MGVVSWPLEMRVFFLTVIVFMFLHGYCDAVMARKPAFKKRKSASRPKTALVQKPPLFEKLGGAEKMTVLVEQWIVNAMADERIRGFLKARRRMLPVWPCLRGIFLKNFVSFPRVPVIIREKILYFCGRLESQRINSMHSSIISMPRRRLPGFRRRP
jgi:hypothetical protein